MIEIVQSRRILGLVFAVSIVLVSQSLKAAEPLTLLLRWDHQYQFAGYYAALWKGYYSDAGLDVTIKTPITENGEILNSVDEVVSGSADFAIGGADILVAYDQGKPVVVVSTIFQESAAEYYVNRDSGYTSLADLLNLRVARRIGDLLDTEFQAMLKAEGLDPSLVKPATAYGSDLAVANGTLDVSPGYSFVSPFILQDLGVDFITLRPRDHGVYFYGDSLFTRQALIESSANTVDKFVAASVRGWEYSLENPEEIADLVATRMKRKFEVSDAVAFNRAQIEGVKKLTLYPLVKPGHINPGRWQHMHDWLQDIGMVSKPIDLGVFIHDPLVKKEVHERMLLRYLSILFVTAMVIGVLSWIWFLRRAVVARTSELTSNIEQRKKAEAALQELNLGLEEAVEIRSTELRGVQDELQRKEHLATLGQLTATVNHELRNPLAAIRTALYMLHKTVDVENHDQVATSLGLMDRNVDRCDHIIDQMLDFTRVQSLDREDVLLDEWLLAVMDEQSIPEAVTVECKMNLPGRIVSLNPDGFRRAVINLVDNACKAMTENADQCDATRTARLKISTQAIDDRIEVEVADNGPGIPEDVLPHIFEPLYSTRGFGVGLGLPTVRQLLQQHGGDVKVETVVGKGTRMLLWFPINKATEAVE